MSLTKVVLEGPLGKQFGRVWHLDVNSPSEALRLIDANKPGLFGWIKNNLEKYSHYRVVCEYEDGSKEELDESDYQLERKVKAIRYVPLLEGAGNIGKIILGVVLIVVAIFFPPAGMGALALWGMGIAGAMMVAQGVIGMLTSTPQQSQADLSQRQDKTSYYFNGPQTTTKQGVPVPLIYGTVLTGSHAVSGILTIDQLL